MAASPEFKVLPFRKGRPAAGSDGHGGAWGLGWIGLDRFREEGVDSGESMVYLGSEIGGGAGEGVVYWAAEVSEEFGDGKLSFVELRTLMVATDWEDEAAMAQLAIAGHVSFSFSFL